MFQATENLSPTFDQEIPIFFKPVLNQGQSVLSLQFEEPNKSDCPEHGLAQAEGGASNSDHESIHTLRESRSLGDSAPKAGPILQDPFDTSLQTELSNPLRNIVNTIQNSETRVEEARHRKSSKSLPPLSFRANGGSNRENSISYEGQKYELKEPVSAEIKSLREDKGISFLSDIVISKPRRADEQKKTRKLLPSKPVTISMTFDAFVDQVKGREFSNIASNYPDYKIDKRLIFLGKEVDYPWHIISYHSTFRRVWNLFILIVITYQIFWYPICATFIYGESWPDANLIFEIVSIFIFLFDILINIRTTYSNENNEEIINGKMMRRNYVMTKLFIVDVITTLPVPEVLLLALMGSAHQWKVFSLVILVRMLRVFKISTYLQNRTLSIFAKLLRIFATFFIVVHWVSCVWYIIIKAEYSDSATIGELWFPNNLRMVASGDEDLIAFYHNMETVKVYGLTLLSVFMLAVGSDMAPATNLQIWFSVFTGLFGAVSLAYIFGLVTLVINRANQEASQYQQQLEELKHKLKVNKIPHNLKVKVMEYFYYSWRKHSVLKKMDDFSELSLPLQRDIALYQHQEMIKKVPLFKELDPVEILSIIQKLKTAIYMPGDKIVREGERGNEMFFIQEGVAEKLIKKPVLKTQSNPNPSARYERMILEKGAYFGEVALMSNSKRNFDVNAFEFCILYTLSRSDYESLKNEFRDIGPRLRSGLKHYKNTHMHLLIQILQKLDIFKGFTIKELQRIGDEYLEEVFVDPDRVILDPKERINAIYVILNGTVNCYIDNEETRNYLNNLKRSNNKDNWTIVDVEEEEDIECLDDDILNLEKDKLSMEDQKRKLDLHKIYGYGDYFGTLDFDVNEIKCDKYYVSDTGCQIGAITQALKSQMENEDPELYEKLRNNIIRCSPKRVMVPIQEESDSSITTKNNTFLKARVSRRASNFSGKKPMFVKTNGKKDEIFNLKEELQQLEDEMNMFKALVSETNAKMLRIFSNSQLNQKSEESSPDKVKTKMFSQHLNAKHLEKLIPKKRPSNILLGVEEDNIEENVEESRN